MFKSLKVLIMVGGAILSLNTSAGIIFSEDFSSNSLSGWSNDDLGSNFEIYTSGMSGIYGTGATYDHDNDVSTPEIPIPNALEINSEMGDVTLFSRIFQMSEELNSSSSGFLSYFAGVRGGNATGASVEIFNVTQGFSLTGTLTNILFAEELWVFNTFSFDWATTQLGDNIQIIWTGGGTSSADGQHIADITLQSVTNVSEPKILLLFSLALLVVTRFRKYT